MTTRRFRYAAANGEHHIQAALWAPESAAADANSAARPRGVLQISHGMHEYGGRYEEFAEFMTGRGYVVCVNDHAGHGDSYKSPDMRGYFGARDGHLLLVRDMRRLMELVRAEYPGLPYFLLGHSMGSFLARNFCALYGDELDGAIFSGTGNAPPILPLGILLCKAQIRLLGGTYRSRGGAIYKMTRNAYLKRFVPIRTGSEWLTRDEKMAAETGSDPKKKFIFTASGNLDLFHMLQCVSSPRWAAKIPAKLPVLLFSGSDDPVGKYGKDVRTVFSWLVDAGCADVTMKIYEGGRHEMLNEINRAEVFEDVAKWIAERVSAH